MNVTVEIKCPEIADAITKLAESIALFAQHSSVASEATPTQAQQPEPPVPEPEPALPFEEDPIPVIDEPKPEKKEKAKKSAKKEKTYTLEDIATAGAKLLDEGKMEDLINLLKNKYGVAAVNLLDPKTYPQFAEDLRAMGADI